MEFAEEFIAAARLAHIDHYPVEAGLALAGNPTTGFQTLSVQSGYEIGVWEMAPGSMRDVEVAEVSLILDGCGTVTHGDGRVDVLEPGNTVILAEGEETVWVVESTVRKIYCIAVAAE
ncbi:MAG: cupin domain-containing protein [Microbacteriaceae bacterium]